MSKGRSGGSPLAEALLVFTRNNVSARGYSVPSNSPVEAAGCPPAVAVSPKECSNSMAAVAVAACIAAHDSSAHELEFGFPSNTCTADTPCRNAAALPCRMHTPVDCLLQFQAPSRQVRRSQRRPLHCRKSIQWPHQGLRPAAFPPLRHSRYFE